MIFRGAESPDTVEPIVQMFVERGYEDDGLMITLSRGMMSLVLRGIDKETIRKDMYEITKEYLEKTRHLSITRVVTEARADLDEGSLEDFWAE